MNESRGLPIAAYLAMLVALALAAAFVAVLSIVILLPPRPADVMRADVVTDHFTAGYDHMVAVGRPMTGEGMAWRVQPAPNPDSQTPQMQRARVQLARDLGLDLSQVRMLAGKIVQSDVFVFRVRDVEEIAREAERAARDAERIARQRGATADEIERLRQRAEDLARHAREQAEAEAAQDEAEARAEAEADAEAEAEMRMHFNGDEVTIDRRGDGAGVRTFEFRTPTPDAPEAPAPAPRAERTPPVAPVAPTPAGAPSPPAPPVFAPAPAGVLLIADFEVSAQLPDGRWLVMRQGRNWAKWSWIGTAALIIGGALAVLSLLALFFARRLTSPIRNFAGAVQAVGVDPQSDPVREEGPRELRGAARAVNTMQARLRALIADRTKTLAAVAHDMRTPLMRLRLAAENAPAEQRERMAKDIAEVEALVASFIAFARDDPAEEARVRLDLSALVQSLADDHAVAGRGVSFESSEDRFVVTGQSLGLRRLFSNLLDNALKYGGAARIKLRREEGWAVIDVEDDGPGVPVDQRESVFEPFVRLNEEGTRGAGLGLAAARSIARAHGGDIVILDAEQGACVRVTLPA